MSYEGEERRKFDRRETPRRVHDLLEDTLTEEEKQQYDRILWSKRQCTDKRFVDRRLDVDRRKGG